MVRYRGGDGVAVVSAGWANRLAGGDCANSGALRWGTLGQRDGASRSGRSPPCSATRAPPPTATTPGTGSATAQTSSGGGRFGGAVRRPASTSAGAGGGGGGFGGAAARLAATLFRHLAEAFELEALIVLRRDIELLGRSFGVANGELEDLPGGNLPFIHVRTCMVMVLVPIGPLSRHVDATPNHHRGIALKPNHRQRLLQQPLPLQRFRVQLPRATRPGGHPALWRLAEVSCQVVGADDPGLGATMR